MARNFRGLSLLLIAVMLLAGMFAVPTAAEGEGVCEDGRHIPAGEAHPADYFPCLGGYTAEWYICENMDAVCDAAGNELDYLPPEEDGRHTPGVGHPANYSPCSGGYDTQWYVCTACQTVCDSSGSALMENPPVENGRHTPGKACYPADYANCTGGYESEYYLCIGCPAACDAEGNAVEWRPAMDNAHTPGGEGHPADYHPCTGGFDTEWYVCAECGKACDLNGAELERKNAPANTTHSPGGECHPANYAPCGQGGYDTEWYECTMCGTACDAGGIALEWRAGTADAKHSPGGELHPADYAPCRGGYKSAWYECAMCGHPCDENGDAVYAEWSGSGRHTPGGIEYPADFTPCGGGSKVPYYRCVECGALCDKDGSLWAGYFEPEAGAKHTPGPHHAADYTPCMGGYKSDWYTCVVCGAKCTADGDMIDPVYQRGNGIHIPGSVEYPADYTPCGGGYKKPYYICTLCGEACTKAGVLSDKYLPPEDSLADSSAPCHSPSGVEHPADYSPCTGGCKVPYYTCSVCGKPCTKDKTGVSYSAAVSEHKLSIVSAKAPTAESAGNVEHLICSLCGSLYKDEQSAQDNVKCSLADVTLPKLAAGDKPPQPTPSAQPGAPKTGDESALGVWAALLLSGAGAAVLPARKLRAGRR